ncbi:MAG TPA: hypothetical protein VLF66_02510 [Thermoanaerobaculia bacterium]|nr:hypothetical protein [Thermoanaerobaculia bacterium]
MSYLRRASARGFLIRVALSAMAATWLGAGLEAAEIHACVKENPEGNVRIVGDPDDCRPNERPLTWNVQGPAGPPGGGSAVHYAEQTQDVTAQGVSVWLDVTGAEVTFGTPAGATLDLFANGAMSTRFGSTSFIRCGLRFVVDGLPTGHPVFGDMLVSPARNGTGGAEWSSFTVTRRVAVGPGPHTVGLQVAQVSLGGVATDLACALDERDYSGVRLYVTVR